MDGWAGAVMRKPLGIQKCDSWTDRPTNTARWSCVSAHKKGFKVSCDGQTNKIGGPIDQRIIPCFQKQVSQAKTLLCIKYLFLEIWIGFAKKHITYHLFMQNFVAVAQTVKLPLDFEIWWNLMKFCLKIVFSNLIASIKIS